MQVGEVLLFLREFAPLDLAEAWDNVGLLLGDAARPVERVITCLTLTADVAEEAVAENAQLVVSHHPILFKPVQRLTSDTAEGAMILKLISAGVAVFSPHTAFDSALDGINADLARRFGLVDVQPLRPAEDHPDTGSGRYGRLTEPMTLDRFLDVVRSELNLGAIQFVGEINQEVSTAAIACGAAGEFLGDAVTAGCDVFVTGETRFHTCLEARTAGIGLILAGHYATERPAVELLAERILQRFPQLTVWASRVEADPVQWKG